MINGFLQFLKKQKLAIHLAKEDMLFLLYPLPIFHNTLFLSRFFVKKSKNAPSQRVETYVASHRNELLSLYATTLALSYGVKPPHFPERVLKGDIEIKQALSSKDYSLGEEILPELALSNPKLEEEYLLDTLDLNSDMRLYGAELSEIQSYAAECGGNLRVSVDWQQTSAKKLYVIFSDEALSTTELPLKAQQNLAKIFFYLLYRKAYLVLDWHSVLYDMNGQVLWDDFSVIRNISRPQQRFALKNALGEAKAENREEYNIKRAMDLLRFYCPQVNLEALSKQIGANILRDFKTHDEEWSKNQGLQIQRLNAADGYLRQTLPNENIYSRLKSKPLSGHMGKNSIYYWGPLVLAAFALYFLL